MSANTLYVSNLGLKQCMRVLANIFLGKNVLIATDIKLGYSNVLHKYHGSLLVSEAK
jgi:hypothetical protein